MFEFVHNNCFQALETLPGEDNHVTSDPHLSDSASTYIEDLSDMNSILESQVVSTFGFSLY